MRLSVNRRPQMKYADMLPRSARVRYHAMNVGVTTLGIEGEGQDQATNARFKAIKWPTPQGSNTSWSLKNFGPSNTLNYFGI